MSLLNLSIATTDYDHFRDLRMGFVKAEGIDLTQEARAIRESESALPTGTSRTD